MPKRETTDAGWMTPSSMKQPVYRPTTRVWVTRRRCSPTVSVTYVFAVRKATGLPTRNS